MMRPSGPHFFPLTLPFIIAFLAVLLLLVALFEIGMLEYAYEKIGIGQRYISLVLVLSLLGSFVNIPVARLPAEPVGTSEIVTFFGIQYVVPRLTEPGTILAVNVGGAVIPTVLSMYLAVGNGIIGSAAIGVAVVALAAYALARPIRGVGIVVPMFVPPVLAVLVARVLTERSPAALAYIAGTLGTLIGGDLLNLGTLRSLGAPVASIGGAGTFDGIFLTGIVAVWLA